MHSACHTANTRQSCPPAPEVHGPRLDALAQARTALSPPELAGGEVQGGAGS